MDRETHPEGTALAYLTEYADSPTIGFNRQAYDIETEAQPVGVGLTGRRPVVPVEEHLETVRRDADSTVGHVELDGVLVASKADKHRGILGGILQRVGEQIGNHTIEP